ncbi:MAG: flavin-containing monooxygenase [Thermoleophilaceae bacterium]
MERVEIAIVGAGFSGLGMAIRLKQEGIDDFVVIERGDDIGGTWRDNAYPGCQCDIASHLYSYSFAPNPDWSRGLSPQPEIHAYLRDCAERFGVVPHLRLGHEVEELAWDEETRRWRIGTNAGSFDAKLVVQASGPMSEPVVPDVPGRFEGTAFHSARWPRDFDPAGRRVAVVGTGASAIQIVPEIQPLVERLVVVQRTPPWVAPKIKRRITRLERRLYRRVPIAQRIARTSLFAFYETIIVGLRHPRLAAASEMLAWQNARLRIRDRELLEKVRPRYRIGCKRLLLSNGWYPALAAPNAEVVNAGVRELRERSIVTADGQEHDVDAIVWATGFRMTDPPIADRVRGRGGLRLGDLWYEHSPRALRGMTAPGFPNYFMLAGPNTGSGNNSLIYNVESQIAYVLGCLRTMSERRLASVEPTRQAEEEWTRRVRERFEGTVWATGCASHYLDRHGRNVAIWPDPMLRYRAYTRRFDPDEYVLEPEAAPLSAPPRAPAAAPAAAR